MALVLTLKPNEKVRIGESVAYIEYLPDNGVVHINVDGRSFPINDEKQTEVLPNVMVSTGDYNEFYQQYRVLFEAPRDISIYRENRGSQC